MNIKKQTIVVVEDEDRFHEIFNTFFKSKDYNLIYFDCTNKLLKEILSSEKEWDILLIKSQFKDMSFFDFYVEIKNKFPLLPIVSLNSINYCELDQSDFKNETYTNKNRPINFLRLKEAVDQILIKKENSQNLTNFSNRIKFDQVMPDELVGRSPKFLAAIDIAKKVAKSSANILITGESGTGKELFANFIHNNSNYIQGPFIAINCSSIPENLLESELFGHTKGSFTGAISNRIGLFESAKNGTLFLDEIGDLSMQLQAKLLRVLQEKQIKRVGENNYISILCRIISATHKNLLDEIKDGRFREDLYFRLNVIQMNLPPLRDRQEDLLLLAETFLKKFVLINHSKLKNFSKEAIKFILENKWRGNVRELQNLIERAVVLSSGFEITLDDFIPILVDEHNVSNSICENQNNENIFTFCYSNQLPSLNQVINQYIAYAIYKNNGARDKAAKDIGIDRKTLYRRMQSFPTNNLY